MDLLNQLITKAKKLNKTIVLPEAVDERVIQAAQEITRQKIAQVILVGNPDNINQLADSLKVNLEGVTIIDPASSEYTEKLTASYQKKREKKGMTLEMAKEVMLSDTMFYGAMLVAEGIADGLVGGAINSTAHTLRSLIQCVGTKAGAKIISSFFAMISPKKEFGTDGIVFFADCGVMPEPNEEQLVEIAEATVENYKAFTEVDPKVAFLSFSTKGSAKTEQTEKTVRAFEMFKAKRPDIMADGELQLDAALVPSVAKKKAPQSPIEGSANVLIFPDLQSGNIGYKLAQRFGDCVALGPLLQGAAKPVNDLSRGCSVDDIVNVTAITAVQAG